MKEPTKEELLEAVWGDSDDLESKSRTSQDGWRHGVDVTEVFYRKSDETFWSVWYRETADGEYHGLRDGEYEVEEVVPELTTTIVYRAKQ